MKESEPVDFAELWKTADDPPLLVGRADLLKQARERHARGERYESRPIVGNGRLAERISSARGRVTWMSEGAA